MHTQSVVDAVVPPSTWGERTSYPILPLAPQTHAPLGEGRPADAALEPAPALVDSDRCASRYANEAVSLALAGIRAHWANLSMALVGAVGLEPRCNRRPCLTVIPR